MKYALAFLVLFAISPAFAAGVNNCSGTGSDHPQKCSGGESRNDSSNYTGK